MYVLTPLVRMAAAPVKLFRNENPGTPQEPPVAVQVLPPLYRIQSLLRSTHLVSQFDVLWGVQLLTNIPIYHNVRFALRYPILGLRLGPRHPGASWLL